MRRPTDQELRATPILGPLFGSILDLGLAVGISIEDLPDILPEHPEDNVALRNHMNELFERKGLPGLGLDS